MHGDPVFDHLLSGTRRSLLQKGFVGLGAAALSSLLAGPGKSLARTPARPNGAKHAISLVLSGAPSQIDLFDHKPELSRREGENLPESVRAGQRLTTMTSGQDRFPLVGARFKFHRHDNGGEGLELSELLPHLGKVGKDITLIRSMWTNAINHDPAITYLCTGRELPGWPSLGAWLSYGLGSLCDNLPTYVVMTPTWSGRPDAQALYQRLFGAGMLPSRHQGVPLRREGDPILFLKDPPGVDRMSRRRLLDALARLNAAEKERSGDPEIDTRVAQYEMAYRMQASVPELFDLSGESEATLALYGPEVKTPGTFAASCLLARRLVERGVRFVQIFHRGWDQHFKIPEHLPRQARDVDQPSAGLVLDLKQRGLLDETLVSFSGEFGRTAYCQGALTATEYGRDHHPRCFSAWLAGGGVKGGEVYGKTDDFSYNITENPVHVRDLNATILHLLGLNHESLSVRHQGLEVRLTGVEPARVVREILKHTD